MTEPQVKRYELDYWIERNEAIACECECDAAMRVSDNGDWVALEDYDALALRLAECEKESRDWLDELEGARKHVAALMEAMQEQEQIIGEQSERIANAEKELANLRGVVRATSEKDLIDSIVATLKEK